MLKFGRATNLITQLALCAGLVAPQLGHSRDALLTPQSNLADIEDFLRSANEILSQHGETDYRASVREGLANCGGGAARSTETVVQIWLITYGHAVYEQYKYQMLTNGTPKSLAQLAEDSLAAYLNNLPLYSSLLSAEVTGCAVAAPLNQLAKNLLRSDLNLIARNLLTSHAATAITFGSWAAGETLIHQSSYALNPEDLKVYKTMSFFNVVRGLGTSRENEVMGRLVGNAFAILTFYKMPEHTAEWSYNTIRLNANGDFLTTITLFATTSAITSSLLGSFAPGIGNLAGGAIGFVTGLGAGALSFAIPEAWKSPLTDRIYRERIHWDYTNLAKKEATTGLYQSYLDSGTDAYAQNHARALTRTLRAREDDLNEITTAYFEEIYRAYAKYQDATASLAKLENPNQIEALVEPSKIASTKEELRAEFTDEQTQSHARLDKLFARLFTVPEREAEYLKPIVDDLNLPPDTRAIAAQSFKRQAKVLKVFVQMYSALLPDVTAKFNQPELNEIAKAKLKSTCEVMLNLFYLRGYKPSYLKV